MHMLLGKLQTLLHELYALDVAYEVDDFVTTDADLAHALDTTGRPINEKLLIAEADGEAEVALYLERELLERLERHDPLTRLDADNLADFWSAFEGVSHFTYYAWNAELEKSVTLFELELQAEVDKFVATLVLLRRQDGLAPRGLHGCSSKRRSIRGSKARSSSVIDGRIATRVSIAGASSRR
jgi:hypothetical protein